MKWSGCQPYARAAFYHRKYSFYSFLLEGYSAVKSNDPIGNWNFPPIDKDNYENDDDDDDIGDDNADEEDVPTRRLISPTY
jgi:hypothetical protein